MLEHIILKNYIKLTKIHIKKLAVSFEFELDFKNFAVIENSVGFFERCEYLTLYL